MRFRLVDRLVRDAAAERSALVAGLRARPAAIPPKYFYDELGCALYGAICELCEVALLLTIAAMAGKGWLG